MFPENIFLSVKAGGDVLPKEDNGDIPEYRQQRMLLSITEAFDIDTKSSKWISMIIFEIY